MKMRIKAEDDEVLNHSLMKFCVFDWLKAIFADEWCFNKIYFDLFRAVVRFHMKRILFDRPVQECESRRFSEARADRA